MLDSLFIRRYLFSSQKSVVKILSIISVLGISLGVASMIVVLAVMNGFDKAIEERNLKAMPHVIVKTNSKDEISKLKKLESSFVEYTKQDVLLRTVEGVSTGAIFYGLNAISLNNIASKIGQSIEIIETENGRITSGKPKVIEAPIDLKRREVAIGYDLARSIGVIDNDEITLIAPESLLTPDEAPVYEKFIIKALIRTEISELDTRYVFFNQSLFPSRFKDTASLEEGVEARLPNPYVATKIAGNLKKHGYKNVLTWQDLNQALFYSLKMEKRLMGIFLALTILVSSFSIMSVLFLLVAEKRKDVGVLKSMGAKASQIAKMFLKIGVTIGFGGIVSGSLLGLLICYLLLRYPIIELPDVYYDTRFPVLVDYFVVTGIIIFGFLVTVLSSYLPARLASRQSPIEIFK
ncbi:MAG: ABC transporter permease [Oligoflexia bacterium]|nr:ABC transporter permease [Oligoflexia bacterium]